MALTDLLPNSAQSAVSTASTKNPLNMVVNARGMLDSLVNDYILKPVNAMGIGGFIFDYEGDTQVVVL